MHSSSMDRGEPGTEVSSENDALLPLPPNRTTNDEDGGDRDDLPATIESSAFRLATAGLDFWITGVAVAAIGVCVCICYYQSLN
jgi:hypothetical protein